MPHNQRRWQPATILFHFPSGVDESVAAELKRMGISVSGPGVFDARICPQPPPLPTRTNLDVTTLCALCSEVCNGGQHSQRVHAWAARTSHWRVRTRSLCIQVGRSRECLASVPHPLRQCKKPTRKYQPFATPARRPLDCARRAKLPMRSVSWIPK